ncbi:glycerophosphodiester phosphodiesterase [Rothia sp. RSM407]|uniref:glycerophosphodiester phosphodiesterase n=1 Tax=Rothia sp. RSM407 TaxID=3398581 RepID=UPI00244D074E|nr:glycerophosphodiester phosphodiesterase family protein [Rothia mucilaginosa]
MNSSSSTRGAGNISPEHTAFAYAESVRRGALAVEIFVRTTSDGQFVCMHNTNIKHTTGASMDVRGHTLAKLRQHKVNMRKNLGEKTDLYDSPPSKYHEAAPEGHHRPGSELQGGESGRGCVGTRGCVCGRGRLAG